MADQEAHEAKYRVANEALAISFPAKAWHRCSYMEVSVPIVEPRRQHRHICIFAPTVPLGWLAPSSARRACDIFACIAVLCVRSNSCPRDDPSALHSSCTVKPQKPVELLLYARVGCPEFTSFTWGTNRLEWNERMQTGSCHPMRTGSFHSNRPNYGDTPCEGSERSENC